MNSDNFNSTQDGLMSTRVYDWAEKYAWPRFSCIMRWIVRALSPTWWFATHAKAGAFGHDRAKGIILRNYFYLSYAIIVALVFGIFTHGISTDNYPLKYQLLVLLFLYVVTWARCNEILFAFIVDALDKTKDASDGGVNNESSLTYRKRIKLALLSYIELIINYAVIYFMMPPSWFGEEKFGNIIDAVYFSGVTITTLGYGDYSPSFWVAKLLVIHQVLTGFTLVIVSFAVYAGKGLAASSENVRSNE
ncbi:MULTISPECIES: potassium channel family protein [Halomonadaceae]|uniref:potassium channel family protein n=1 Tax=Halomonadaceae TaxID=28256 RepID=UPI0012FEA0B5|nr:potassium channel family protein [Halomonas sp. MES3-P3E]